MKKELREKMQAFIEVLAKYESPQLPDLDKLIATFQPEPRGPIPVMPAPQKENKDNKQ